MAVFWLELWLRWPFLARALALLAMFWLELNVEFNVDLNVDLNVELNVELYVVLLYRRFGGQCVSIPDRE